MDITIIYATLLLLTAPIIAIFLAKITKDEKDLIKYYFPTIITIFAITSIILFFVNISYAFITTHFTIILFTWLQITTDKKPKRRRK
jgi:ABC-type multidrug transport system permease subunit